MPDPKPAPHRIWAARLQREEELEALVAEARDPATPLARLRALAGDAEAAVAVARNPAAPAALLAELCAGGGEMRCLAASQHPACPASLLEEMVASGRRRLRRAVAASPNA